MAYCICRLSIEVVSRNILKMFFFIETSFHFTHHKTMHYRHQLVFENNAALSSIQILDGKVRVSVHSDSPKHIWHDVTQSHLFPLVCTRSEKDCVLEVNETIKSVNRKLWEVIDAINRHGEYELPGASDAAVEKQQNQINDVLQSVGLKYRVISEGTVLKPEFIDLVAGI
jgi:hypothetical protein